MFDDGYLEPAQGESIGHFQADIATTDDDCPAGQACFEILLDGKAIGHPAQQVDAGKIKAADRRPGRGGTGGNY